MKLLTSKLFTILSLSTLVFATEPSRVALKNNGQLLYAKQMQVDSLSDMFLGGELYGRLRNNNFYFSYNHPDNGHVKQLITGIGASLVYNSAIYKGFDTKVGFYASQSFFDAHKDELAYYKAGKDTLSRYNYFNKNETYMAVVGQANIGYTYSKSNLRVGRQLVETFYTKSNDTKMIPNTFDGAVLTTKDIPSTQLTFAYLTKQKLRDHTQEHSLFMVGDVNSSSSLKPQWSENDDSAMHKGLTYSRLKAAGKPTDAPLIVLDLQNNSIKNLQINFASYLVPELLSQAMGELNYKIALKGFSITPGFRYIQQCDRGAGAVGGASLNVLLAGSTAYKDPNSLNAKMIAARVVTRVNDYKINLAYTNILDEADLVTPWRGFPTAGYTRSMGMYNWKANTASYRLELVKGANKSGIYTSPFIQTSVLYIDGDAKKTPLSDSMFYYVGLIQNIPSLEAFQYRVRLGYRDFIGDASNISDYVDSRLEFNYLF